MSVKGRTIPRKTPELIAQVRAAHETLGVKRGSRLVGIGQRRFRLLLDEAGLSPRPQGVAVADDAARPLFRNRLAYCRDLDPNTFVPDTAAGRAKAADICRNHCVVMEGCLQHAINVNEEFGVWGGCTETERDDIKAKWNGTSSLVVECESCERGFVPLIDGDGDLCAGCRKEADALRKSA